MLYVIPMLFIVLSSFPYKLDKGKVFDAHFSKSFIERLLRGWMIIVIK